MNLEWYAITLQPSRAHCWCAARTVPQNRRTGSGQGRASYATALLCGQVIVQKGQILR